MSKYIIKMGEHAFGTQYFHTLKLELYLFLADHLIPNEEQQSYINDVHQNMINKYQKFGHCILKTERGKIEVEGYALAVDLRLQDISCDGIRNYRWAINELNELKTKTYNSKRNYEKIIGIELDNKSGCNDIFWHTKVKGTFNINFNFEVFMRSLKVDLSERQINNGKEYGFKYDDYDWYSVPSDAPDDFIPGQFNIVRGRNHAMRFFPYSKKRITLLQNIIDKGIDLHRNLRKFLFADEKELENAASKLLE